MTDLAMDPRVQQRDDAAMVTTDAVRAQAIITEQQVLIGSAAALAGPTVRRRGLWTAVRALFGSAEKANKPEKTRRTKHYPTHYEFIEYAAMSRMMQRL